MEKRVALGSRISRVLYRKVKEGKRDGKPDLTLPPGCVGYACSFSEMTLVGYGVKL